MLTEHNLNNRLVPLDTWEREWIAGALKHALKLEPSVYQSGGDIERIRLSDLLRKVKPTYAPVQTEELALD